MHLPQTTSLRFSAWRQPLRAALLAAAVAGTGAAWAQQPPAAARAATQPAQASPAVQQWTLPNGLQVIVKPDHRAPTAVHMLWLRVGAMDEVDGASGVAHVLEHMMFKGTPSVPAGAFSRRVAEMGGQENAFTAHDYTGYYQQIPATRLPDVMRLEADRFAHNRWPDAEFQRERAVVQEERRLRTDDNPRALLWEQLSATAFVASPYRRPIIGWMGDLDSLRADDVRDFHRRWYVPANAALVVVGDVDPARVLAQARRIYGAIAARAVPERKPRPEPEQMGPRRIEVKAPAEQGYVALAFKVPRLSSLQPTPENDDALALTVLAAVLDGYSGARLERALTQGPDRLADSAGAGNGLLGRGPQLFVLDGVPAAGKSAAQLEAALREQVARIAREGVSEAELARVKTQWVASEVYKRDAVMAQARELGNAWALGLPLDLNERLIERLQGVSAARVQQVAQRYFGDDRLTTGTLVPQPSDARRAPRAPADARHGGELR